MSVKLFDAIVDDGVLEGYEEVDGTVIQQVAVSNLSSSSSSSFLVLLLNLLLHKRMFIP
jgi:hypothetical protein